MQRSELSAAGIQLPVLPTLVLGGLPGDRDWVPHLLRIGIDVISSGAVPDTDETLRAAAEAAPYRPVKAVGGAARLATGRPWLTEDAAGSSPGFAIDMDHVVIGVDASHLGEDPNMIAARLLDIVRDHPSEWWVAASGLDTCSVDQAAAALTSLVDGVRMVRLFLAKQQFDI